MRRRFSGRIYFSLEQAVMAKKASDINQWLDDGETILGTLARGGDEQLGIAEALEPGHDDILCAMVDGTHRHIYGYKREPVPTPTEEAVPCPN